MLSARTFRFVVAVGVCGLACAVNPAHGQDTLRVYGAEGPAFPVTEAGAAFERQTGVGVEVISGPPAEWLERAAGDANIIYSSAEFMMTNFLGLAGLKLDPATVTPLYVRPSAILVRPGNPRNIRDFPDLLPSGIRVMVVNGSGQTGLWEDMAGRARDPTIVKRLRANIAVYAESSTEACNLWKHRADIDAWITWNIWHVPMRSEAAIVQVSPEYRIYRECSAALTARGLAKKQAREFMDFLLSVKGREIFISWSWLALDGTEATGR